MSATIYRHAEDHSQDEETAEIGAGFSVDVCRRWEEAFFETKTQGTRKIALRLGIVLGRRDGVFPRLLTLVKIGLGGKQGNGKQYVSWVHEQDFAKCTEWLLEQTTVDGIINCTAPVPVKNEVMMKLIRNSYGIKAGLPAPVWLLKLGALIIGTEPELILKSRWVVPARLLTQGYQFMFPKPGQAVNELLSTYN